MTVRVVISCRCKIPTARAALQSHKLHLFPRELVRAKLCHWTGEIWPHRNGTGKPVKRERTLLEYRRRVHDSQARRERTALSPVAYRSQQQSHLRLSFLWDLEKDGHRPCRMCHFPHKERLLKDHPCLRFASLHLYPRIVCWEIATRSGGRI